MTKLLSPGGVRIQVLDAVPSEEPADAIVDLSRTLASDKTPQPPDDDDGARELSRWAEATHSAIEAAQQRGQHHLTILVASHEADREAVSPRLLAEVIVGAMWQLLVESSSLEEVTLVAPTDELGALLQWSVEDHAASSSSDELALSMPHEFNPRGLIRGAVLPRIIGVGAVAGAAWWARKRWGNGKEEVAKKAAKMSAQEAAKMAAAEAFEFVQQALRLQAELDRANAEVRRLRAKLHDRLNELDSSEVAMPIAYAMSVRQGALRPTDRVRQLQKALAIVLRYLGAVALAAYESTGAPSNEVNRELRGVLTERDGDGRWLHAARDVARVGSDSPLSDAECPELVCLRNVLLNGKDYSPTGGKLHGLIKLRNDYVHDPAPEFEEDAEMWLEKADPLWRAVLQGLEPLTHRRLVYVESELGRAEDREMGIRYQVRWLLGDRILPGASEMITRADLTPRRVYLAREDQDSFLPLHPFLTYQACGLTHTREAFVADRLEESVLQMTTFRFSHTQRAEKETIPQCLQTAA